MYADLNTVFSQPIGAYVNDVLSSPRQMVAHAAVVLAVALVMAGALARTMMPLRWLAAGSNVWLIVYGALHPSMTTLVISAVLLPINLFRAIEVTRLTRRVHRAEAAAEHAGLWLRPYMKARRIKAGQTLFKKGDKAEHLFMLVDGSLQLVETGRPLQPGRIFGEIALFSPSGLRTQTVVCKSDSTILQIHDSTVKQLYYQDPSFGFHLIGLLAERLINDVDHANALVNLQKSEPT
jgi:CRP-like cAMP-binding protein